MNNIPSSRIYPSPRCGICLDDFETDRPNACLALKCGHIFHETCATPWLESERKCPLCRHIAISLNDSVILREKWKMKAKEGAFLGGRLGVVVTMIITALSVYAYFYNGDLPKECSLFELFINVAKTSAQFSGMFIIVFSVLDAHTVYKENPEIFDNASEKIDYVPSKEVAAL